MRSTLTLLCLMFLCTLNAVAQQLNVTGSVKDALGEYIIGASVLVKGTTNGTITNIDGNFSVRGVEKGSVLEISYIGYVSQSITINDEKPLQIILKEDSETLEEVVVVGYGVQKKANLTSEPAGRLVCQPYGNMGRFAGLVRTILLCVLYRTLQGLCQQIFAHHHHEVDVYLLFHLHDSLLCQRFDERRLGRTEGGGNWQSDLYRGRCYLRQLHADCGGTKESPSYGSWYVQLYPAACGLYRSRMLGNGFLQHDQNHCRGTYFRWSISGDFQP